MLYPQEGCLFHKKLEVRFPRSSRESCSTASSSFSTDSRNNEEILSQIMATQIEDSNNHIHNFNFEHLNEAEIDELSLSDSLPPIERYKTELCRNYQMTGICNYGRKCQFAHGRDELNLKPEIKQNQFYKTRPCKEFFKHLACPYGQRCKYHHNTRPLKQLFKQGSFYRRRLIIISTITEEKTVQLSKIPLKQQEQQSDNPISFDIKGDDYDQVNSDNLSQESQNILIIKEHQQILTQLQKPRRRLAFFAQSFPE